MRIGLIIAGLIVLGAGLAAVSGKLDFKQKSEVAKVGGMSLSVNEDRSVPEWLGIVAIVLGGGLIAVGAMQKT